MDARPPDPIVHDDANDESDLVSDRVQTNDGFQDSADLRVAGGVTKINASRSNLNVSLRSMVIMMVNFS